MDQKLFVDGPKNLVVGTKKMDQKCRHRDFGPSTFFLVHRRFPRFWSTQFLGVQFVGSNRGSIFWSNLGLVLALLGWFGFVLGGCVPVLGCFRDCLGGG